MLHFCCRFINTKHHAGLWLNSVKRLEHIDLELDDNMGLRRIKKVINVLGTMSICFIFIDNITCQLMH